MPSCQVGACVRLQALLGAMEQQEVAVAKGGMCAALPARSTVIAAANPAGGTWQPSKTLLENLKLSPALLSRFDLAFVMLDTPDRQHDARLSEEVLAKHAGGLSACRPTRLALPTLHSRPRPWLIRLGKAEVLSDSSA